MSIRIQKSKCVGCGRCIEACPGNLIKKDKEGKEGEEPGVFLNDLVMEEVLAELKDIAQRDGISCQCGSHQWRLEVHYASVELICAQCGSAMRINAGTMDDLNELCCHPKLTIRSSPA